MATRLRSTTKTRLTKRLCSSLEKTIVTYAGVATAAGVGLLGQPAEAKIIFTSTNQSIIDNGTLKIDLDGNGITDFTVIGSFHTTFAAGGIKNTGSIHPSRGGVWVYGAAVSNEVVGRSNHTSHAAQPLMKGVTLSSRANFLKDQQEMAFCYGMGGIVSSRKGPWFHATDRYLGLKFVINGQTHFGWARLTVRVAAQEVGCQFKTVLTGYAYETVAGKPIITGETSGPTLVSTQPATLGRLARGTVSPFGWRKEPDAQASK